MADKESVLSIVIKAVDRATSVVRAVNARVEAVTRPAKDFTEAIKDLGENSGLNGVIDGFKGVGGAIKDLLGKLLAIGGIAGAAVLGVKALVDEFDDMGDAAEKIGVGVDFLASMRYAAERSGAEVSALDSGLQTFSQGLGQLRANTGKLLGFVQKVSPALATQFKNAKNNEQAFLLLADAMAKIKDPAKRAALAAKTVGDASLAPLLARGSKGIAELRARFTELAGSQEGAAAAAGETDDSMKDLHASIQGIKASIVSGLAPALKVIVDRLAEWFSAHRADVKQWAEDIGTKVPAAVNQVVDAVTEAVGWVTDIVDDIGGWKVAAVALAAVLAGPLISSVVALGVAIASTPVGWILAGIAAITFAGYELVKHWDTVKAWFKDLWDRFGGIITAALPFIVVPIRAIIALAQTIIENWEPIKAFFAELWDTITFAFSKAWEAIKTVVDKIVGAVQAVSGAIDAVTSAVNPFGDGEIVARSSISQNFVNAATTAKQGAGLAKIIVDFANAPVGTRARTAPQSTVDVDMSLGFQMFTGAS